MGVIHAIAGIEVTHAIAGMRVTNTIADLRVTHYSFYGSDMCEPIMKKSNCNNYLQ